MKTHAAENTILIMYISLTHFIIRSGSKARILQKSNLVSVLGSNFTDKFDEGLKNVTFIDHMMLTWERL